MNFIIKFIRLYLLVNIGLLSLGYIFVSNYFDFDENIEIKISHDLVPLIKTDNASEYHLEIEAKQNKIRTIDFELNTKTVSRIRKAYFHQVKYFYKVCFLKHTHTSVNKSRAPPYFFLNIS